MKMEAKKVEELSPNEEVSPLFREFKNTKPRFASNQEAKAHYLTELEKLASHHCMTVNQLIENADDSDQLSPSEQRQAMRLSNLISTLGK